MGAAGAERVAGEARCAGGGNAMCVRSSTSGATTAPPVTAAAPTPSATTFAATGALPPANARASVSSHDAPVTDANVARSLARSRRRARKSSDSTAGVETASAAASSSYDRPPNSRSKNAFRCGRGSASIASHSAARSALRIASASGSGSADAASTASAGSGSRMRVRIRLQHSFRAIVASQAAGCSGRLPFSSARCAERKVCCAASSASVRLRSSARQRPDTVRPYSA